MPFVQKGRVFKDEENVIFWISDDENKIPVKIKASILVGSVKAELIEFNGLAHPFPWFFNYFKPYLFAKIYKFAQLKEKK